MITAKVSGAVAQTAVAQTAVAQTALPHERTMMNTEQWSIQLTIRL